LREAVEISMACAARKANAGMFERGSMSRGFWKCSQCHESGYLPPTRARSGPVRREPHKNGRS
jgi:hypothetical protein